MLVRLLTPNHPRPNHALQRTATAVTAPASCRRLSPAAQEPRQPPRSLSLGSLGDSSIESSRDWIEAVARFLFHHSASLTPSLEMKLRYNRRIDVRHEPMGCPNVMESDPTQERPSPNHALERTVPGCHGPCFSCLGVYISFHSYWLFGLGFFVLPGRGRASPPPLLSLRSLGRKAPSTLK